MIIFDVRQLYYLPQYLPVYAELDKQGIACKFLFYLTPDQALNDITKQVIENEHLTVHWVVDWSEALNYYLSEKADWIIFGNTIDDTIKLNKASKTALMQHGIGPKSCYYNVSNNQTSVRFVEGQHRLDRLNELFPTGCFVDTGYAKLDPAFNKTMNNYCLKDLGLDPQKKTLLYAPTFYPSSIGCFPADFASQFSEYNIILKPHFFTLTRKKYQTQKKLLEHWQIFDNVYLAPTIEYNLVPFMMISDVLISDASSAIFEFAALDKPVVWCNFFKLRWGYRGILNYRFKQRLDQDIQFFNQISEKANNYYELQACVEKALVTDPNKSILRRSITVKLAGLTDGQCASRITQYLLNNK